MGALERVPAPSVPPAAISRVLSRFGRAELEGFISVAIDLLDLADGDPDGEDNGDEADGTLAEDEDCAAFAVMGDGPGCIASDNDTEHDGREEQEEGI